MPIGFRVFFVDQNDNLRRIPLKRFEAFYLRGDKRARFREYAKQRIRYILVTARLENRRPAAILRIDFSVIKFDSQGCLDDSELLRGVRLAMDSVSSSKDLPTFDNVIDANGRFSKSRYEHEFRWKPSEALKRAIEEAVLGHKRT